MTSDVRAARQADAGRGVVTVTVVCSFVLALVAGAIAAINPEAGLALGLGAITILVIVANPTVRVVLIVLGALAVLQSAGGLNASKMAYLGVVGLAAVVSLIAFAFGSVRLERRSDRRLVAASVLAALTVVVSTLIGTANGNQVSWALRDTVGYALAVMLPIIGLAAAPRVSSRIAVRLLVIAGSASALAFCIDWVSRRGVSELNVERLGFSSTNLVAALVAYSLARAVSTRGSMFRWSTLAGVLVALLLITGSRSAISVLAPLLVIPFFVTRQQFFRALSTLLLVPALLLVSIPVLASRLMGGTDYLSTRLDLGIRFVSGEGGGDLSYLERLEQYGQASEAWSSGPWFGTGPGFLYPTGGIPPLAVVLDTPLITPAKFGVIGLLVLLVVLVAALVSACPDRSDPRSLTMRMAVAGYAAFQVANLPFGSPFEDKGMAIVLLLLILVGRSALSPGVAGADTRPG